MGQKGAGGGGEVEGTKLVIKVPSESVTPLIWPLCSSGGGGYPSPGLQPGTPVGGSGTAARTSRQGQLKPPWDILPALLVQSLAPPLPCVCAGADPRQESPF